MVDELNDEQIKHMVDRFLGWRLPENFSPDAGISFKPEFNVEYMASLGKPPMRHAPVGTNLFDATQATAMVRHMVEGINTVEPSPIALSMAGVDPLVGRLLAYGVPDQVAVDLVVEARRLGAATPTQEMREAVARLERWANSDWDYNWADGPRLESDLRVVLALLNTPGREDGR